MDYAQFCARKVQPWRCSFVCIYSVLLVTVDHALAQIQDVAESSVICAGVLSAWVAAT